jgi:hypothetical protein
MGDILSSVAELTHALAQIEKYRTVRCESLRSSAPLCGRGLLEPAPKPVGTARFKVLHFSQSFVVAERFDADLIRTVELTR